VAPTEGNIQAAERLIADLGVERSLYRRFARLEEVETLWKPKAAETKEAVGGVFAHLKAKGKEADSSRLLMQAPPTVMTWDRFSRVVLPAADSIKLCAPYVGNYTAIVTAEHADAPPILQWDREDRRNPFSHYMYLTPTPASRWNLAANAWISVTGISFFPHHWHGDDKTRSNHAKGILFLLAGARDMHSKGSGMALFPDTLIEALRPARSTIEAFSKSRDLSGADEASACGLVLQGGGRSEITLSVTSGAGTLRYTIDRLE
jgi:hypothetical protein